MFNKVKIDCLNFILSKNNHVKEELAKLVNCTFNINMVGFCLSAMISNSGELSYYSELNSHDVEILIPLKASSYFIHRDSLTTFKQLTIIGNQKLGREILEILAKINLNNLYPQSPLLGVIFLQVESFIDSVRNQIILMSRNSSQSISEYLLYETNDLVSSYEINEFCNQVDAINERSALLELKINRLMNQLK